MLALGHPQEADLHLLCQVHFSGKNLPEPPSPWGWFNAVVCAPVVEPSERKCSGTGLVQMDVEVLYADLLIYFKQCSRNIIVFPRKYLNLWKSWGYQHVRAHWQKPRKKSRAPACSSGLPCCCSVPGAWAVVTPSVGLSCSLHPRLAVVCGVLWAAWKDSRLLFSPKWRRGSWLGWNGLWYWQSALSPLGAHSSLCGHPLPACLSCI